MATPLTQFLQQPDLVVETCYKCSVQFGMPRGLFERLCRDHDTFFCPNGHGQAYTSKSEEQKLREELEREQRRHEFTRNARDAEERRAEKAAKTRARNRAAKGFCPRCSAHFPDLEAHVAAEHPETSTR